MWKLVPLSLVFRHDWWRAKIRSLIDLSYSASSFGSVSWIPHSVSIERDSPEVPLMQPMWPRVVSISRPASWLCALLIGVWLAWSVQPVTVEKLRLRTEGLQFSYADIYSELHEQPFAWCDSYYPQREEALTSVRLRARDLRPSDVLTFVRDYDATMSAHYEEDCRIPWHAYSNPANFQKVFTQDYPLFYLISELRLTEVRLALLQFVAAWMGLAAVALLAVYFWRSPVAPVAALLLTSWIAKQAFVRQAVVAVPGAGTLGVIRPDFLFPAVTILLILAMMQPILKRGAAATPAWIIVPLALTYAVHTLLYYAIDPPVARLFALIGLAYVGAVGLGHRRWQVVGTAALAAALQLWFDHAFARPGLQIYSAVTLANHLASEAYTNLMVYMGFFERPSPFGLFYMDEIFGWIIDQDPVLVHAGPFMAVHHSYAEIGRTMVRQAITTEPLMVLDAVFRRVLIQMFYRPLWSFWTLTIDWVYTSTLLSMFAVNLWAWRRRALFLAITPITLCLLVNQFAVNTVITLVHTHNRWNNLGVMLMFAVAPLYLFVAVRLVWSTTWRWPHWRLSVLRSHPYRVGGVVLVLGLLAWLASFSFKTLKQEREFVRVWMTLHQPPPEGIDIDHVVGTLETIRTGSGDRNGEIAMWTATILKMYLGRSATVSPERRTQLGRLQHRYFDLALAAAPGNPHFIYAAWFLQIEDWESYLLRGLEKFPTAVYAPGAASALLYYGRNLPEPVRESVARRSEALTAGALSDGPDRIPGFLAVPEMVQSAFGAVTARKIAHPDGRGGLLLTMAPGAVAFLSDRPTHGSPATRLVSYVDLQEGTVEPGLAVGGPGRERTLAPETARVIGKESQRLAGRYQFFAAAEQPTAATFGMWLRAGANGATVEVRDYYPIVEYPNHYYRSGLMDRVRRRAARAGRSR
jgi:hypothetical protein